MSGYLPEQTVFAFLTNDFESAWNCLASKADALGRGSFFFALQALILLEWAERLASSDRNGLAKRDLISEIRVQDAKYFTPLPYPMKLKDRVVTTGAESSVPALLDVVFDLVRNGQAHQYHQIQVQVPDGEFGISLGGAEYGNSLDRLRSGQRPGDHLTFFRQGETLWLKVNAGVLFFDVKTAIERAHLLDRGLNFGYIRHKARVSLHDVVDALRAGGHRED